MAHAKKYNVGKISRKDLVNAIEHLFDSEITPGNSIVRINSHRGKKYEIRARRKAHGMELDWGLPGTFFCPYGYDNER
jgi:hypothetical protein